MKRIYILGVNGNARDILDSILAIRSVCPDFPEPGGFLDDQVPQGTPIGPVSVVGTIQQAALLPEAVFVNAIGSPTSFTLKQEVVRRTGLPSEAFVKVIHPLAAVSPTAKIGAGSVLLSHVSVGSAVQVGDHVMVLQNTVISHDSVIEDYSVLATGVCVSGSVRMGRNVYVGSHVSIRGGLTIGETSLIGMGSVVVKDVPVGEIWCGNPARFLRTLR